MTFNSERAIYLQMADRICDEILSGTYADDARIPSVREYAVSLEVNSNTAVKAYEQLARDGIIYTRRGLGYFVTAGARERILEARRHAFLSQTVPDLFRQMRLLGIDMEELEKRWKE